MGVPKSDTPRRKAARPSGQFDVASPRGGKSAVKVTVNSSSSLPAEGAARAIQTIKLKRQGGSLMMTVPASARDALHLREGQEMTVAVEGEAIVLKPVIERTVLLYRKPKYTLDELVAQSDPDAPASEEREWMDAPAMGREVW